MCESSKLKKVDDYPTLGALIGRVIKKEHEEGWAAETMQCPDVDQKLTVKMVILSNDTVAKGEAIHRARERDAKMGEGVCMWWTSRSQSDDGIVGVAVLSNHRNGCKTFCSHLGTGRVKVYDVELWAMRLALQVLVGTRIVLQTTGVMGVAIVSESQAVIQRMEHQDPGHMQPLARMINQCARTLRNASIEIEIHLL